MYSEPSSKGYSSSHIEDKDNDIRRNDVLSAIKLNNNQTTEKLTANQSNQMFVLDIKDHTTNHVPDDITLNQSQMFVLDIKEEELS